MGDPDNPDARGSCECGWRGPWRTASSDAGADVKAHCAETGCIDGGSATADAQDLGDLMPHERYQKKTQGKDHADR